MKIIKWKKRIENALISFLSEKEQEVKSNVIKA